MRFCQTCSAEGHRAQNAATKRGLPFKQVRAERLSDVAGSQAAGLPPPPPPRPPSHPPAHAADAYQSHAAERLDLMTGALVICRTAIADGYEVTVLRDGDAALIRLRVPEVPSVEAGGDIDTFVASRMAGGAR
jgi:hypothetical protein